MRFREIEEEEFRNAFDSRRSFYGEKVVCSTDGVQFYFICKLNSKFYKAYAPTILTLYTQLAYLRDLYLDGKEITEFGLRVEAFYFTMEELHQMKNLIEFKL